MFRHWKHSHRLEAASLCLLLMIALAGSFTVNTCQAQTLQVTVTSDHSPHTHRDTVKIFGNVTHGGDLVNNGLVAIQVNDPMKTIVARTLPAVATPPLLWDIEIVALFPCNGPGAPAKSTIRRGIMEYFNVTIRNGGPLAVMSVRVTINVFDNESIPLDISSTKLSSIGPGQTYSVVSSLWIDEWAALGKGTVYATIWSDFPEEYGYPYTPEKATVFNIVDVGIDGESALPPPSSVPGQSYNAAFRLPPDALPETYRVFVAAWHEGWKAYTSMSLWVYLNTTSPRASFVYWPPKIGPNLPMTFNASSSTSEAYNDTIASYRWTFGDGNSSTSKVATKSFSQAGQYTVTLNVTDSEGLWNTTTKIITVEVIHDIALTSIEGLTEAYANWKFTIKVTALNKGTVLETFNMTAFYDGTAIATQSVTDLFPYAQTTLLIAWNTTGVTYGTSYTLRANATILPAETNTTNNSLIYGQVLIKMLGDVMYNRAIDIFDVVAVTATYEFQQSSYGWNIQTDLQPDGIIDIFDVVVATSRYETTC